MPVEGPVAVTVTGKLIELVFPHGLVAYTLTFIVVADEGTVTVITFDPWPAVIVPADIDHVYPVAPLTGLTVYVIVLLMQTLVSPLMAVGVAGVP